MNNQFESFVETLRCMGVKTLKIEFQQTTTLPYTSSETTPSKKTIIKEGTALPHEQPPTEPKKTHDIFDVDKQPEKTRVDETILTEEGKPVEEEAKKDTGTVSNKSAYDQFWAINEEDDGGAEQGEQRRALIGRMTQDEIIRINNDCELGIDTDQPLEKLRNELATCF